MFAYFCISLIIFIGLAYFAVKSKVAFSEWIVFVCFFSFIQFICVMDNEQCLVPALVFFACFIGLSFFIKFSDFKKEKAKWQKRTLKEGQIGVVAELTFADPCQCNCSMTIKDKDGLLMGNMTPFNNLGYAFTFTNPAKAQSFSFVADGSGIGGNYAGRLYLNDTLILQISSIDSKHLRAEGENIDYKIPLYSRTINYKNENGQIVWSLRLFYEGFLLECNKDDSEVLTCVAYLLWFCTFAGLVRNKG